MVDVSEVTENIFMIDNQLFSIPKWGSVYVINEEQEALVETGPATSIATVIDGIRKIGIKPEDISYIIVTHIHLDHAGGAGALIKETPQAKLVVHHKGARHLADPSRLVRSVIEAQDSEVMVRHGEVTPVEIHRLLAVYDGDTISLGDKQTIKFIDAPGHAPHEMCIYETRNGGLFAGDAVGVYIAEPDILLPYHAPPHFDLKLCLNTLERLAKLAPRLLYYSHFGVSDKVKEHLNLARDKLIIWDDIAASAVKEGAFDDISRRLTAQACAELESMKRVKSLKSLYEYLVKIHIPVCAAGYTKYYQAR
jgi:glyoxylase-like metal-dependent hydrolase (beta-lactamase superfamily II)